MADEEDPQAPQAAQGVRDSQLHKILHPHKNPQIPLVHNAPQAPQVPQQPAPHMLLLNWSHFKPEFSRKPDKDAKAHLLKMNDWMDTNRFQDNVKVQRFCLTLTQEVRLQYKSLGLINVDWVGLQNNFRQQYSKIGNTREQLFHTWRSFPL